VHKYMALKVGVSILKSTNKIESSKLHIRGNNTRYENTTIHNYKYLDNVDSQQISTYTL
jgi:hypothetical protein